MKFLTKSPRGKKPNRTLVIVPGTDKPNKYRMQRSCTVVLKEDGQRMKMNPEAVRKHLGRRSRAAQLAIQARKDA